MEEKVFQAVLSQTEILESAVANVGFIIFTGWPCPSVMN